MSAATTTTSRSAPSRGPLTELLLGGGTARRVTWILVGLMLLLSVVRIISGEQALTSSSTFATALLLAVPIGLAGLGGLFAERAGVVNIGLEGMMILGTWGAGWAGYQWGWAGAIAGGILFGAAGGLLHAVATVTFGVDHVVSGVAINILAGGIVRFLSELVYVDNEAGGGVTQSPALSSRPPSFSLPVLSDGPHLLGDLADRQWFLVSDLAGLRRGLTNGVRVLTLISILRVPLSSLLLAVLLLAVAIFQTVRGKYVQAVLAAAFAALSLVGFLTIDELPEGIVSFTPHLITLLVLSLASQRLRMPKADGLVYRRGEH